MMDAMEPVRVNARDSRLEEKPLVSPNVIMMRDLISDHHATHNAARLTIFFIFKGRE
jgi:hypothetical protein